MLDRLDALEAEIRMSVIDTSRDSVTDGRGAGRSHDQAAEPASSVLKWSCDCTQTIAADSRLVTTNSPSLSSYRDQRPVATEQSTSKAEAKPTRQDGRPQKAK